MTGTALDFGKTFGAHTLGTFVGGTAAVPPGMILYDLAKTKVLKQNSAAPNYMGDEFKKEVIGKGVAEGLKIHQMKNLKWAAAFYGATVALTVVPTIVSMMRRKANAGRSQLASGVQQIGEKAANNIKGAAHQSSLVITPEHP